MADDAVKQVKQNQGGMLTSSGGILTLGCVQLSRECYHHRHGSVQRDGRQVDVRAGRHQDVGERQKTATQRVTRHCYCGSGRTARLGSFTGRTRGGRIGSVDGQQQKTNGGQTFWTEDRTRDIVYHTHILLLAALVSLGARYFSHAEQTGNVRPHSTTVGSRNVGLIHMHGRKSRRDREMSP